MPVGFEEKTALIPTYRSLENPDCVEDNTDSILSWPQQEAIVAYRLAHNIFNNERYLYLSQTIERSAYEYFADREQGRWYVSIKKGSLPVSMRNDREGHIEGPFHLERMLLALITIHEHGSIIEYIH